MAVSRHLRLAALIAGMLVVTLSSAAEANGGVTRVLTMSPPNLPESIAIDHNGNFYIGQPFANRVIKVTPDGKQQSTIATFPSLFPLGVRLDNQGNAFIAVVGSGVWEVPAAGGAAKHLASGPGLWNGIAFDHRGNLFVSESGGGAVWRLAKDGTFTMWSGDPLLKGTTGATLCGVHPAAGSFGAIGANEIAFNKHGDMLVANTDFATIVRIPVNRDGSAGAASVFAGANCDLWGADGIDMDNQDNLYVAANAAGKIDRVDPSGHIQVLAAGAPLNFPADVAFGTGRDDRKQLFIANFAAFPTSDGAPGILKLDVGIPGRPIG